jgi:hypothetical protein
VVQRLPLEAVQLEFFILGGSGEAVGAASIVRLGQVATAFRSAVDDPDRG